MCSVSENLKKRFSFLCGKGGAGNRFDTVRAILFDLDGVLISTDLYHYQAWKSVANELNVPFDEEINERMHGVGRMESLEILLENWHGEPLSDEQKKILADRKNDFYRDLLGRLSPESVPGMTRRTLNVLRARGYKLAVASSSRNAGFILDRVGLSDFFDTVTDGNMISRSKPDPEVFLLAAGRLRVKPEFCAVVEDAEAGLQAASAAKMLPIAVGAAQSSPLARATLRQFCDLLRLFE